MNAKPPGRKFHPIYLCLVVPFVALLWFPFFNRLEPRLAGIPFFYWYQMMWAVLVAGAILPIFLYEKRRK